MQNLKDKYGTDIGVETALKNAYDGRKIKCISVQFSEVGYFKVEGNGRLTMNQYDLDHSNWVVIEEMKPCI